jgi:transposase
LAVRLRDEFGALYRTPTSPRSSPGAGQPALPPWRLALVTVLQFLEGLTDRQAADAVRARIDWKYALSLELTDAGFDYSVLSEFRARLVAGGAEHVLLDRLLAHAAERGLVKARTKQRTDSTHVLAAVRTLNRLELVGESVRAALNALAATAPDWLRAVAPPEWHARYDHRFEEARMPATDAARERPAAHFGGGRRRAAGRRRRAYRAARAPRAASRRGAPPGARALLRPRARGRRAVGR